MLSLKKNDEINYSCYNFEILFFVFNIQIIKNLTFLKKFVARDILLKNRSNR